MRRNAGHRRAGRACKELSRNQQVVKARGRTAAGLHTGTCKRGIRWKRHCLSRSWLYRSTRHSCSCGLGHCGASRRGPGNIRRSGLRDRRSSDERTHAARLDQQRENGLKAVLPRLSDERSVGGQFVPLQGDGTHAVPKFTEYFAIAGRRSKSVVAVPQLHVERSPTSRTIRSAGGRGASRLDRRDRADTGAERGGVPAEPRGELFGSLKSPSATAARRTALADSAASP